MIDEDLERPDASSVPNEISSVNFPQIDSPDIRPFASGKAMQRENVQSFLCEIGDFNREEKVRKTF